MDSSSILCMHTDAWLVIFEWFEPGSVSGRLVGVKSECPTLPNFSRSIS
ncbi:MAG: hypothetical protein ACTSU9_17480 [Promethearchaeota archaeon]